MALVVVLVTIYIGYVGYDYYSTPFEDRFYHDQHDWFKPSGIFGHGLGIIGTLMILFGVVLYIVAKKYGIFDRFIRLKYILEFHIFLCTLGPILILYHTTFKFGGIVSIAFWSMVAVVLSGVAGRYIYIQIPRSKNGRELSLDEIQKSQSKLIEELGSVTIPASEIEAVATNRILFYGLGPLAAAKRFLSLRRYLSQWKKEGISTRDLAELNQLISKQWKIRRRLAHVTQMQKLFKYWHVIHRPFALIMLVIVVIHISISLAFGYTWIW